MAIKVGQGLQRTSVAPIDESLVLSKAQMLTIDDTLMPSKYFAICTDDGKLYLYNKEATPSTETGKYTVLEGGGGGSTPSKTYTMDWVEVTKSLTLSDGTDVQTLPLTGIDSVYIATIGTTTAIQLKEAIAAGKIILCCMDPSNPSTTFLATYNEANTIEDRVRLSLMVTLQGEGTGRVLDYIIEDSNGVTSWQPTATDLQTKFQVVYELDYPTAEREGLICQYVGETDANHIRGYFYECKEIIPATDPKTYEWVNINVQSGGSASGLPGGGTTGQALVKTNDDDGAVRWESFKTINGESIQGTGNISVQANTPTLAEVVAEGDTLGMNDIIYSKWSNQGVNFEGSISNEFSSKYDDTRNNAKANMSVAIYPGDIGQGFRWFKYDYSTTPYTDIYRFEMHEDETDINKPVVTMSQNMKEAWLTALGMGSGDVNKATNEEVQAIVNKYF